MAAAEACGQLDVRMAAYLAACDTLALEEGDDEEQEAEGLQALREMASLAANTQQAFPELYPTTHPAFIQVQALLALTEVGCTRVYRALGDLRSGGFR